MANSPSRIVAVSGTGAGSGAFSVQADTPTTGDYTVTDTTSGQSFVIPAPIGIGDVDDDTKIVSIEGGGANGGDRMDFIVDNVTVGSVEVLAGGITKWTLDGILDPVIYAGTPQTTVQRDAFSPSDGYLLYNSDDNEYQFYDGSAWVSIGGSITLASAISPASDDATGAVGTGTDVARVDHKHPAQAVSADAENFLKAGSDDLHMLDPDDMISADIGNTLSKGTDSKLFASAHVGFDDAIDAADDSIGDGGVATTAARSDHKHIAQSPSSNANNILVTGTDGLHHLPLDPSGFSGNLGTGDDTLQEIAASYDAYKGEDRIFADNSTVSPAIAGSPSVGEITAFLAGIRDVIVYYTGDDLPASEPTYVFHADKTGTVTLLKEPSGANSYDTYSATFAIGDWTAGSPNSLLIAATTHGLGAGRKHVTVYDAAEDIVGIRVNVNSATGDITLMTTGATFAGSVFIS